ncbi:MAG TPA: hypothetical protein VF654_16630, partial [Pyrinomonadaceae bacterium]
QIAQRAGLNRATVRAKLETKGVRPKQAKSKEKLYDAEEALGAVQAEGASDLRKAQTMKTAAEAARAKLKLKKEIGDVVPITDVRADLQELMQRVREHFTITAPPVLAPQLRGQKVAPIEAILRRDAEQFFRELRAEFESYLNAED